MGSTISSTGFIFVVVFLTLMAVLTIAGCVVYMVKEWKEIEHTKPVHGPSKPPYPMVYNNQANAPNNTQEGQVQIVMQPPPYSAIDQDAPPPYTPYGVLTPAARRNSMANRPTVCLTPRPLHDLNENATEPQHYTGAHGTLNTGSTNTPMTTPAGSMFTTSIGGTRDTSASSNMRSVNMVHIENDHL